MFSHWFIGINDIIVCLPVSGDRDHHNLLLHPLNIITIVKYGYKIVLIWLQINASGDVEFSSKSKDDQVIIYFHINPDRAYDNLERGPAADDPKGKFLESN